MFINHLTKELSVVLHLSLEEYLLNPLPVFIKLTSCLPLGT